MSVKYSLRILVMSFNNRPHIFLLILAKPQGAKSAMAAFKQMDNASNPEGAAKPKYVGICLSLFLGRFRWVDRMKLESDGEKKNEDFCGDQIPSKLHGSAATNTKNK